MKKILSGLLIVSSLTAASSAQAQYHTYTSGKPSVEVDLSALDEASSTPRSYDTDTHSTAPLAPSVTRVPLAVDGASRPDIFSEVLEPAPPVQLTPSAPPAPIAQQAAPVVQQRRLLKPVFTQAPAVGMQPVVTPAPPAHPAPQKLPEPEFAPQIMEEPEALTEEEVKSPPPPRQAQKPVEAAEPVKSEPPKSEVPKSQMVVPTLGDLTLPFSGNASEIDTATAAKLDEIISQLARGRLQVRGYAAGEDGTTSSARRIALSRALAVRSYLMDKGIAPTRVDVRALGSETDRSPVDRVDLIFVH